MSSRRFRKLELGDGPYAPDAAGVDETDVCRRCGSQQRRGEPRCGQCGGVLGGPGQEQFDEAFHARRAAAALRGDANAPAPPEPADAAGPRAPGGEVGFGTVLASGALTAGVFAMVSIPVRLAFAAAFRDAVPWRAISELLVVVVLTLLVRRLFAGSLARL